VRTRVSFLYLHGFSATWQETAPVTENLGAHFSANVVQGRVAGHGEGPTGMLTSAEEWLQSTADQFEIAQRVGEQVVIVAMSTGAALAVWLVSQPQLRDKVHACLFMSPNFRVRNPFGFLLTWPWSRHWLHLILGKQRKWEPQSKAESECWTHEYSTLALIEMQKTVNWVNEQAVENISVPLAMMYLQNDSTIHPQSAVNIFLRWGAPLKRIIKVNIDEEAREHVFVGNITAPHRIEWTVDTFRKFVEDVDNAAAGQ
jgi:esterase/lipase